MRCDASLALVGTLQLPMKLELKLNGSGSAQGCRSLQCFCDGQVKDVRGWKVEYLEPKSLGWFFSVFFFFWGTSQNVLACWVFLGEGGEGERESCATCEGGKRPGSVTRAREKLGGWWGRSRREEKEGACRKAVGRSRY